MGIHDSYGKQLMRAAVGSQFKSNCKSTKIIYGPGKTANIDGVIDSQIAVEIESRVFKQIRGALMDLLFHSFPKKLLILVPAHIGKPRITAQACQTLLSHFLRPGDFEIVVLSGTGSKKMFTQDTATIKKALSRLTGTQRANMIWTAWTNGGQGFGFDIDIADRNALFNQAWQSVEIELPISSGYLVVTCNVAKRSFWKSTAPCVHLIKKGIGAWFVANYHFRWSRNQPPKFNVINLGGNRFRVL